MKISPKFAALYDKCMIVIGLGGQGLFFIQAFEIYKSCCSTGVSLTAFSFSLFSVSCWLFYGFIKKDKVLMISNTVAVIGALLCVIAIIWARP